MKFGPSATRKTRTLPADKQGKFGYGSVWTWTAIDADTKLIPSFTVGNRDAASAKMLIEDLASRLTHRIQLTTDGFKAYWKLSNEPSGMIGRECLRLMVSGGIADIDIGNSPIERRFQEIWKCRFPYCV